MEIWLDGLKPGKRAVVTRLCCPEPLRRRLADFGLVEGTTVCCRYRSPAGDVSALGLRGTTLAIRTADLGRIAARGI